MSENRRWEIENIIRDTVGADLIKNDWRLPTDLFTALDEAGWLKPKKTKTVSIQTIPLTDKQGGMYRVIQNSVEMAVFFRYQDAVDYADQLKREDF